MPDTAPAPSFLTLRYRSSSQLAYSVALLLLLEYARKSGDVFEYGPLLADSGQNLRLLEEQGLTICGPDVSGAAKILAEVPGLYLSDDLGSALDHPG